MQTSAHPESSSTDMQRIILTLEEMDSLGAYQVPLHTPVVPRKGEIVRIPNPAQPSEPMSFRVTNVHHNAVQEGPAEDPSVFVQRIQPKY